MPTLTPVSYKALVALICWSLVGENVSVGASDDGALPEAGVSQALARERASRLSAIQYELFFTIPESLSEPVRGRAVLRFHVRDAGRPLVLDFAQPRDPVRSLSIASRPAPIEWINGHLVLPGRLLNEGANRVEINFVAGDGPLNRSAEFLYTLFVPARASQAFPCFDQPDLKARYTLVLDLPAGWQAVANSAETSRRGDARTASTPRTVVRFAETQPIPTYLFSFAAGKFKIEVAQRGGRTFRMFHRETDLPKLQRNRDAVFDLHAAALGWLERYTGIPYQFGKFDFVLVPSFQFGGMEHPGAILYNAPRLLLDETATQEQKLERASLIAHETAHMWFGDLVTMRWFDDVWMKEVMANFFAAKIVNPSFPEIDHDLRFLLAHYPAAYGVDRTPGANPIRQTLENLNEAGDLYGAIIYQKAPVVMRQLEAMMGMAGEVRFQDGIREYLKHYRFANASWLDLVALLDERSEDDLAPWSRTWVEQAGRPTISARWSVDDGRIRQLALEQRDPGGRGLVWMQQLDVVLGYATVAKRIPVVLNAPRVDVEAARGLPAPQYVLPGGFGYGLMELDPSSRQYLLDRLPEVSDAFARGSAWIALWEALLERQVPPLDLIELALRALPRESDELNLQRILGYLEPACWRFLSAARGERPKGVEPTDRQALAPRIEELLSGELARAETQTRKAAYFAAFRDLALTPPALARLERWWRKEESVPGLTFSEEDFTALAFELAVREVPAWREILEGQLARIENPDRKARFAFVMPALSADAAVRREFFDSLADAANRRREAWVIEALRYLHHPLRSAQAEKYVRPSLDLLAEIRRTGDIFFPKRWLDATLGGHNSRAVAETVRAFLADHPDYPPRLRQILLQSADELFRASAIVHPAR